MPKTKAELWQALQKSVEINENLIETMGRMMITSQELNAENAKLTETVVKCVGDIEALGYVIKKFIKEVAILKDNEEIRKELEMGNDVTD